MFPPPRPLFRPFNRPFVILPRLSVSPGVKSSVFSEGNSQRIGEETIIIIIIKRISRAPFYHTRWEHRALYNNTIRVRTEHFSPMKQTIHTPSAKRLQSIYAYTKRFSPAKQLYKTNHHLEDQKPYTFLKENFRKRRRRRRRPGVIYSRENFRRRKRRRPGTM